MLVQGVKDIYLDIAGRADLEVNVPLFQEFDKGRILYTSYAMANSGGLKIFEGLPDALRPFGFAGMRRAGDPMGLGEAKRFDVIVDRKPRLVGGDIKSHHACPPELVNQFDRFPTLCF